jgi:hypothetical protein
MPNAHNVHVICDSKSEETSSSSPKLLSRNKEMITLLNSYRVPVKVPMAKLVNYCFISMSQVTDSNFNHTGTFNFKLLNRIEYLQLPKSVFLQTELNLKLVVEPPLELAYFCLSCN